jgi:carbamoyl-phosphate synthase large subunit
MGISLKSWLGNVNGIGHDQLIWIALANGRVLELIRRLDRKDKRRAVCILFTCIGRRVSLLKAFQRAARQINADITCLGTDASELSPALRLCDESFLVKPTTHTQYIRELLSIVQERQVDLIVPTVDLDLKRLAQKKAAFSRIGCRVLVSDPDVIDLCQDKRETFRFLTGQGYDSPHTMGMRSALKKTRRAGELAFPCFLKPWDGYASRSNVLVTDQQELEFYAKRVPNAICQEYIEGIEFTCDVYVDFSGEVRCVVPRQRLEVRAGEVSKARIVRDTVVIDTVTGLVAALGAGPGVITVQLIQTKDHQLKFIEVNPRFGGGVPLSIRAGANFPKWILQELLGLQTKIRPQAYHDGLTMLRYDTEVWIKQPSLEAVENAVPR